MTPPFSKRKFVSLWENGGDMGEVFVFGEVLIFCRVRLRARLVGGKRNVPCVVPFRLKVTCCSGLCLWWVEIYPPSSVAIATASPQGEAFFTRCVHSKYNKHQVANNTSNSCPFILLRSTKGILQKASPRGEAVAIATDEGGSICTLHRNVSFNQNGTTRGSFPTIPRFRSVLFDTFRTLLGRNPQGTTRIPFRAPRISFPAPPIGRDSRTLQQVRTTPSDKNFPREHPHRTKRNKSLPCTGGCSRGKFSVSEGGLEGESPLFQEGALSLQGLSPSPDQTTSDLRTPTPL